MSRNELPDHWTPVQEAAYLTVHEFRSGGRSGASALAPLVSKTPRSLDNEINPDNAGAKLGVDDAITIMHATRDYRLLEAMATALGFAIVGVGDFSGVSDLELLDVYAAWNSDVGETHAAIRRALADHKVTQKEYDEIEREVFEDFQRELGVLARLKALVEEGRA